LFEEAACKDLNVNIFFPESDGNEAKDICRDCSYIRECRIFGMMEEFGVWGGLSRRGRKNHRAIVRRVLGVTRSNASLTAMYLPLQKSILEEVDNGSSLEEAMLKRGFTEEDMSIIFKGCEEE
jgi:hypothetical protein